jgi:3-hydroxyacyl-[acyl-carrier-protein] dehydratase
MPPELLFDIASVDFTRLVAGPDEIRQCNRQRFEMEQLDGIVHLDSTKHVIIGYKDVKEGEFWARGHMPGYPIFPGVLMCESAAQLCSYYTEFCKITTGDFLGFGGMNEVRFRGIVQPGDRLVIVAVARRVSPRQCTFACQGFVGSKMVFQGDIIGMPMRYPQAPAEA